MRTLLLIAVLILPGHGAGAEDRPAGTGGDRIQVPIGDGAATGGDGPRTGDKSGNGVRLRSRTTDDARPRHRDRPPRGHGRRRPAPPAYVIIDRTRDLESPAEEAAPAETPEIREPVAARPDPAGSAGRYRARGRSRPRRWGLGEILPRNLPHVKLAHGRYDLPAPPAGQIYARVEGDVLLIDEITRRVMSAVPQ